MGCANCGKGTGQRYVRESNEEEKMEMKTPTPQPTGPSAPMSFDSMNALSYETLCSIRKDIEDRDFQHFLAISSEMSDDMKAFRIRTLIRVYNGEEFSPDGHSPVYALNLLHRLTRMDDFIPIFNKFFGSSLPTSIEDLVTRRDTLEYGLPQ